MSTTTAAVCCLKRKKDTFYADVKKTLKENEYREVQPSGNSSVWACFMQIVDKDDKKVCAVHFFWKLLRMQMNESELAITSVQL